MKYMPNKALLSLLAVGLFTLPALTDASCMNAYSNVGSYDSYAYGYGGDNIYGGCGADNGYYMPQQNYYNNGWDDYSPQGYYSNNNWYPNYGGYNEYNGYNSYNTNPYYNRLANYGYQSNPYYGNYNNGYMGSDMFNESGWNDNNSWGSYDQYGYGFDDYSYDGSDYWLGYMGY